MTCVQVRDDRGRAGLGKCMGGGGGRGGFENKQDLINRKWCRHVVWGVRGLVQVGSSGFLRPDSGQGEVWRAT